MYDNAADYNLHHIADHNAQMDHFDQSQADFSFGMDGVGDSQYTYGNPQHFALGGLDTLASSTPQRTTRSGRSIAMPSSSSAGAKVAGSRISKTPKPKQVKRRKPKANNVGLPGPLSEITKDSNVPVRDIDTFIRRPLNERVQEAQGKKKGKTPRPMNSFMLYRSAYADRIKQWGKENNHQVVSAIAGASWAMEPSEVKAQFEEWSEIEKERHKLAFPDYKYSPSKGHLVEEDDRDSAVDPDAGDSDAEYHPNKRAARQARAVQAPSIRSNSPAMSSVYSSGSEFNEPNYLYQGQQGVRQPPASYGFNTGMMQPQQQPQAMPYFDQNQMYQQNTSAPTSNQYNINPYDPRNLPFVPQLNGSGFGDPNVNFGRHPMQLISTFEWPSGDGSIRRQSVGATERNFGLISPTTLTFFNNAQDMQGSEGMDFVVDPRLLGGGMGAAYRRDAEQ